MFKFLFVPDRIWYPALLVVASMICGVLIVKAETPPPQLRGLVKVSASLEFGGRPVEGGVWINPQRVIAVLPNLKESIIVLDGNDDLKNVFCTEGVEEVARKLSHR